MNEASSDAAACVIRLPSRRKAEASVSVAESSEARQKFANAKAISSDMFFGRESNAEVKHVIQMLAILLIGCTCQWQGSTYILSHVCFYLLFCHNFSIHRQCRCKKVVLGPDCIACICANVPFDGLGKITVFVEREANDG